VLESKLILLLLQNTEIFDPVLIDVDVAPATTNRNLHSLRGGSEEERQLQVVSSSTLSVEFDACTFEVCVQILQSIFIQR